MNDKDRYKLYFGPYYPPKVRRGRRLFDEIRGTVVVGGYSDGKIVWPYVKRRGRHALVLCGGLAKAIRRESNLAVAHWWGVGGGTVARWRRALGVGHTTQGTHNAKSNWGKQPSRLARLAEIQKISNDPIRRARLAQRNRRLRQFRRNARHWTPREDALLGTMPDQKLARKLGCSGSVVVSRRQGLGIKPFCRVSPPKETVSISPRKLLARRLALRLARSEIARRAKLPGYGTIEMGRQRTVRLSTIGLLAAALECRPEDILLRRADRRHVVPDDSLLGKMSDRALARKWRLPACTVQHRRLELGIPVFSRYPKAIPDESLLGTRPDEQLAALWCLPPKRVIRRRQQLGIPTYEQSRRWVVSRRKLRACRKRAGMTQNQLASRAGRSLVYYEQIESGRTRTAARDTLERFAAVLNCSVEDFAVPMLSRKPVKRHGP